MLIILHKNKFDLLNLFLERWENGNIETFTKNNKTSFTFAFEQLDSFLNHKNAK